MGITLITADRAGLPEHEPEAELVLVTVHDGTATLVLADGEELCFDASELLAALTEAAA